MELWNQRTLKLAVLPGGALLLGSYLLLGSRIPLPASGINFFYYAVFIAAVLLAWRFHFTRILFAALVLLLGHHAIEFFTPGVALTTGPSRAAWEAVSLLIPLDFALLPLFPERGTQGRSLFWFVALLFLESVFVSVVARPDQPLPAFLDFRLVASYHSRLPQPALVVFVVALVWLLIRFGNSGKPTISGMFWSLAAAWLGLSSGGAGKIGSAYFGVAALILAASIVESSYSLAYLDELTGLDSRRAFNDRLLRLKPPYTVAAIDIDRFKGINDTYGHETGDQVLRLVAARLARVGGGGEPFRVGGEEFTILFSGRTAEQVQDYLELLRLTIENASFRVRSGEERRKLPRAADRRRRKEKPSRLGQARASVSLSVTVSIGVAQSHPKLSVEQVIRLADKVLYQAKQGGRNRIETALSQPNRPVKMRRGKSNAP